MDFEEFYITWFSRVKHFAYEYVLSEADAENIAQDVFMDLYEKKVLLNCHTNIVAYLFTAVKNRSLDLLRRKIHEQEATSRLQEEFDLTLRLKFDSLEAFNLTFLSESSIEDLIAKALDSLPERCRIIFIKSKMEGKKQKEIAEELQISINTVENQMTIAYTKLREELKHYFPLLLFLL